MNDKKKNPLNIWQLVTFLLIGLLAGYIIGRFELTTVSFNVSAKDDGKAAAADTKTAEQDTKTEEPQGPIDVNIEGDRVLGSNDAKILFIDFSDFQCPVSKAFFETIYPDLKKDFIDTGKVKYVFKDFPLNMHPNALPAAIAAECAGEQNKYWEMHDKIFTSQKEWNNLELTNANEKFTEYATGLGLNSAKFTTCLNSQPIRDEIYSDREDGIKSGVTGTPSLFINGTAVRGLPRDYETVKAFIESELSK
jgi:protein-disulfide isomerase